MIRTGHEFKIVKPKGRPGFYVFEGATDQWTVCLPTRREAEAWITKTIANRAELAEEAIRVAEIIAADKAAKRAAIAAARAAAPVQLEMFA